MTFTITITDERKLAGIRAARLAYNAEVAEQNPDGALIFQTESEYIAFLVDHSAEFFARHYASPARHDQR